MPLIAPTPLESSLRDAIAASGMSRYAIAKKIGIAQTVLGRFLDDGTTLRLDTAGKLCDLLGLRLAKKSSK